MFHFTVRGVAKQIKPFTAVQPMSCLLRYLLTCSFEAVCLIGEVKCHQVSDLIHEITLKTLKMTSRGDLVPTFIYTFFNLVVVGVHVVIVVVACSKFKMNLL